MVEFLAGGRDDSLFRGLMSTHLTDIAESILLFQTAVAGSARDRLCQLTLELGLVQQWIAEGGSPDVIVRRRAIANLAFACVHEPSRQVAGRRLALALEDPDEEVRLSACQGVMLAGREADVEELFAIALQPDRLSRIVLTEDLRRYAMPLAAGPVQQALRSGDAAERRAALEIVAAWERAIPLPDLREFLEHGDPEIRTLAFRIAAVVSLDYESRMALLRSLHDGDGKIRGLAIIGVGRQKMAEAVPELALCLRREGLEEARHAAHALAALPPQGWLALEELTGSPNPATSMAAREALAQARKEV